MGPTDLGLVVCHTGLFLGWFDFHGGLPGPLFERLNHVQHIPRGCEEQLIGEVIETLEKNLKAASIQCRHCAEVFTPGWIAYNRTCVSCATAVDGIVY